MSKGSRLRNSALDSAWTLAWKRPGDPMAHFLLPWKARGGSSLKFILSYLEGKKELSVTGSPKVHRRIGWI